VNNSIKKYNLYKAANVTFDSHTMEAYSYAWWRFTKVIDGLLVFNEYRYSATTSKHQFKVKTLMRELGIEIDLYVKTKVSLDRQTIEELKAETIKIEVERENQLKENRKAAYERRKAKMKSKVEKVIEEAYVSN
jgi:hypothetical protein